MKKMFLLGLLILIGLGFAGCGNNQKEFNLPSRSVIDSYYAKHPNAEKVDLAKITQWYLTFDALKKSGKKEIDLRDSTLIEVFKEQRFKNSFYICDANVSKDSTISLSLFSPYDNDTTTGIYPHDQKYIFHSNGTIEIKMGNMVSLKENDPNDGTFRRTILDGETGLVLYYWESDSGSWSNEFQLKQAGGMEIGNRYNRGFGPNATSTFDSMSFEMGLIRDKLKKSKN